MRASARCRPGRDGGEGPRPLETRKIAVSREVVPYLAWPGLAQVARIERTREIARLEGEAGPLGLRGAAMLARQEPARQDGLPPAGSGATPMATSIARPCASSTRSPASAKRGAPRATSPRAGSCLRSRLSQSGVDDRSFRRVDHDDREEATGHVQGTPSLRDSLLSPAGRPGWADTHGEMPSRPR